VNDDIQGRRLERLLSGDYHHSDAQSLFNSGREILIYGAGGNGRRVLGVLEKRKYRVKGFIDKNPQSSVDGYAFLSPNEMATIQNKDSYLLVISVFNAFTDTCLLVKECRLMGYNHIVSFIDLFRHFENDFGHSFGLSSDSTILNARNEIMDAFSLLCDAESREAFVSTIAFRLTGDYCRMPVPSMGAQYFDTSVKGLRKPEVFVDVGAYTGDTIGDLYRAFGGIDTIIAFEADPVNYIRLLENVRRMMPTPARSFLPLPLGVWSEFAQLALTEGKGVASAIATDGTRQVQCIDLDSLLRQFQPDFVKMDIEGAESNAVRGESELIRECAPNQAICVYHHPDHLWSIPLYLRSLTAKYTYSIRVHQLNGFETVLYAVK
jgi:FkbM family methyltransferase